MPKHFNVEQARELSAAASRAFSPRTPVSTQALFAGRWDQIQQIGDTVAQTGLHAVIFGERGVGKTSLTLVIKPLLHVLDRNAENGEPEPRIVVRVNAHGNDTFWTLWEKAFDEIYWVEDQPTIGFNPSSNQESVTLRRAFNIDDSRLTIDDVRRTLAHLKGSVFVFDEFDRLPKKHATAFTDLIKALSDAAIESTIVLVGVSETVEGLLKDHASISRALLQIPMPRMSEKELAEIISKAEESLSISFETSAKDQIVRMSQGLPHFTHLLGLHAVRSAARRLSGIVSFDDVQQAFQDAVAQSDQTVVSIYSQATKSAQPGAKYPQVLLASAIAAYVSSDELGYFQPASLVMPMSAILSRHVEIAGFNQHLSQFTEEKRGPVLERAGSPRAYRYRFVLPLLPPFVLMKSLTDNIVTTDALEKLLQIPVQ